MRIFRCSFFYVTLFLCPTLLFAWQDFQVLLEPTWQNLELGEDDTLQFGGRWILVGSITFKKRSKEPVSLAHITLEWQGNPLEYLIGSLYKYSVDKKFIPIEENLICDSCWNRKKQTLVFNFDEKQTLGATNVFYLVLTIPDSLEDVLRKGFFTLDEESLPTHFRNALTTQTYSLSLNKPTLYARILPHVAISYTAKSSASQRRIT